MANLKSALKLSADKYLHLIGGAGITAIVALWCVAAPWACVVAILAGVLKEVHDHYNGGCVEVGDAIATAAGGLLMQVAIWGYLFLW